MGGSGPPSLSPGSVTASFYVVIRATRSAVHREYLNFSIIWRSRVLVRLRESNHDLPLCSQALYRPSKSCCGPWYYPYFLLSIARIRGFSYREIEYNILTFNPRCPVGPGGPDGPGRPYSNDKENDCKNSTYKPKSWKNILLHALIYLS